MWRSTEADGFDYRPIAMNCREAVKRAAAPAAYAV
jgi:hypothetical protein